MTIEHTPEPWISLEVKGLSWEHDFIAIGADDYAIARLLLPLYRNKNVDGSDDVISQRQWANARRIVACVNACKGIATEALEAEGIGSMKPLAEDYVRLLAALPASGIEDMAREMGGEEYVGRLNAFLEGEGPAHG